MEREELVERLIKWGYLKNPALIAAFRKVPRHEFVPSGERSYAYHDQPLPIGRGQTISAPSMIAIMMETLDLAPGMRVLEIGAGSGYNAALIAEVVGRKGLVVSVERIKELADFARENLRKTGYDWVKVVVGDGSLGYEEDAPWDRILVTACAPELPRPLVKQLKPGGKLGAPVGRDYMFQTWTVVEKTETGEISITEHGGCSFVPLIGRCGWKLED
ncbi:MAG: protein-L-isoaspartate(D-aspartate) O-methyltransferase [Candidatus Hadarchaeum sp.]|uniref:protein-L-isoaspartate(D-aspartate) O-methyltransferase n=1 Tax=Candidatus Hadarchaeum sp. TaxID=2883567 RepID=UPI003D0F97B9